MPIRSSLEPALVVAIVDAARTGRPRGLIAEDLGVDRELVGKYSAHIHEGAPDAKRRLEMHIRLDAGQSVHEVAAALGVTVPKVCRLLWSWRAEQEARARVAAEERETAEIKAAREKREREHAEVRERLARGETHAQIKAAMGSWGPLQRVLRARKRPGSVATRID